MQINFCTTNFSPINYAQTNFKGRINTSSALISDTFEKQDKKQKRIKPKYHFSFNDDKALYKFSPKILKEYRMEKISKECKEAAKTSFEMAKILKRGLDESEGKDNYTLVSIGTSPSGVMRALDYMGEDVRYVPISGLRKYQGVSGSDIIERVVEYNDHRDYRKYLDSIGINSLTINNSPKKFLFYDYTMSKTSLLTLEYLARQVMGLRGDKAEFRSLNEDLETFTTNEEKRSFDDYTESFLNHSKIAKYTGIPHIYPEFTAQITDELKKENSKDSKDFNYALCYYIDKDGLL